MRKGFLFLGLIYSVLFGIDGFAACPVTINGEIPASPQFVVLAPGAYSFSVVGTAPSDDCSIPSYGEWRLNGSVVGNGPVISHSFSGPNTGGSLESPRNTFLSIDIQRPPITGVVIPEECIQGDSCYFDFTTTQNPDIGFSDAEIPMGIRIDFTHVDTGFKFYIVVAVDYDGTPPSNRIQNLGPSMFHNVGSRYGAWQVTVTADNSGLRAQPVAAQMMIQPLINENIDYTVDSFKIGQVLYDPLVAGDDLKVDLIKDKPVMMEITVKASEKPPADVQIPLKGFIHGQLLFGSVMGSDFSGTETFSATKKLFVPGHTFAVAPGDGVATAEVNAAGVPDVPTRAPESDLSNNIGVAKGVSVKAAKPLFLDYVVVKPRHACAPGSSSCNWYGRPTTEQLNALVAGSAPYIKGMFPISSITTDVDSFGVFGAIPGGNDIWDGPISDALEVSKDWSLKRFFWRLYHGSENSISRFIGVVADDYFLKHGDGDAFGIRFPALQDNGSNVGLARVSMAPIVAHELGHTFNLRYSGSIHYPDDQKHWGVWVEKGELGPRLLPSFMKKEFIEESGEPADVNMLWMDPTTYLQLYSSFSGTTDAERRRESAPVMYLQGLYNSDGSIQTTGIFDGITDQPIHPAIVDTNATITLKDSRGQIAQTSPIILSPEVEVLSRDAGSYEITLDSVPFSILIPLPSETASAEIRKNGHLVATLEPNGEILSHAIRSVPERGFLGMATAIRAALLEEVQKIKTKLSEKSYQSARVLAGMVLRPMVVSGVSDAIPDRETVEFDRSAVLQVIDSFLGRVDTLKAQSPAVSNGLIAVQTDRAQYSAGEKSGIEVVAIREPTNRELEYAVGMVVNGLSQRVERVDQGKWSATSRRLESGVTSIVVQAYLQNRRDAAGFEAAKRAYEQRILDLQRERSRETDPDRTSEIDREIHETEANISQLNEALGKMRTAVGVPLEVLVESI